VPQGVERLLALQQIGRQGLEQACTLLEIQLQQRRHAHVAGVVQGLREIDRLGMGVRHGTAIDGTAQQAGRFGADPAVGDQALKDGGGHGDADPQVLNTGRGLPLSRMAMQCNGCLAPGRPEAQWLGKEIEQEESDP
jgi:hypothetical protein